MIGIWVEDPEVGPFDNGRWILHEDSRPMLFSGTDTASAYIDHKGLEGARPQHFQLLLIETPKPVRKK